MIKLDKKNYATVQVLDLHTQQAKLIRPLPSMTTALHKPSSIITYRDSNTLPSIIQLYTQTHHLVLSHLVQTHCLLWFQSRPSYTLVRQYLISSSIITVVKKFFSLSQLSLCSNSLCSLASRVLCLATQFSQCSSHCSSQSVALCLDRLSFSSDRSAVSCIAQFLGDSQALELSSVLDSWFFDCRLINRFCPRRLTPTRLLHLLCSTSNATVQQGTCQYIYIYIYIYIIQLQWSQFTNL